jgi:IS30 family transposase
MADPNIAKYVIERLERRWTPEQISGRARLENFPISFSHNTIYRAIDHGLLPRSVKKLMRFKNKYKKRKTHDKREKMQGITEIGERPACVDRRERIGDWGSDTVLGTCKTGGAIGTHVDRKTGFLISFKLNGLSSEEYVSRIIAAFSAVSQKKRKTFTVDRGKEFTNHDQLSASLNIPVYFCDPYSPWQRGTNENTNGLIQFPNVFMEKKYACRKFF